jgi:hypothetical protein
MAVPAFFLKSVILSLSKDQTRFVLQISPAFTFSIFKPVILSGVEG